jgi:hypothetical protein
MIASSSSSGVLYADASIVFEDKQIERSHRVLNPVSMDDEQAE